MKARIMLAATLTALTFSCSEKPEDVKPLEPSYQPENRLWYCGQILDIKSAVRTENGGECTFYLSPSSGITDADEMISKGNSLIVNVGSLQGYKESFDMTYRDFTMGDADVNTRTKAFDFSLDLSGDNLELYIWVVGNDGKELVAGYSGPAPESVKAPVHLANQFLLDGRKEDIGSVLDWRTAGKTRTYYICSAAGITKPESGLKADLEITIPEECYGKQIDLSAAEGIVIRCSGEDFIAEGGSMEGTLTASAGRLGSDLGLSVDISSGSRSLKVEFSGNTSSGYFSSNTFGLSGQEDSALNRVFGYQGTGSLTLAFGNADRQLSRPEDLRDNGEGQSGIAVRFTLASNQIGSEVEIGPGSAAAAVFVYDYDNVATYSLKKGDIASGSILVLDEMQDGRLYAKADITLVDGRTVNAEYFGEITMMDEDFDISPILPEASAIIVTDKDENELQNLEITSLRIRKTESFTSSFGETTPAYVLYFINANSAEDPHNDACTPQLAVKDDAFELNGSLDGHFWHFVYTYYSGVTLLQYGKYGSQYNSFGYCPASAVIDATWNEDKSLDIIFSFKDEVISWGSASGTGNTVSIEWHGKAELYTGSQENLLTESDLK